jgi:hypothetical protein
MAKCDINDCNKQAVYDAKTICGPWAYVCEKHFKTRASGAKGTYTELGEE